MRKLLLLTLLLFMVSSLQAYSKKIILSAFSNADNAKRSLEMFKETASYKELSKLNKTNSFKVYVRESGKYHIVVAEPILVEKIGTKAYEIVTKEYKNAYLNDYEVPQILKVEKQKKFVKNEIIQEKVVKLPEVTPKVQSPKIEEVNITELKEEAKPLNVGKTKIDKNVTVIDNTDSMEKSVDFTTDIIDTLKYIAIFLIFMVLVYYYREFKRIYDEY